MPSDDSQRWYPGIEGCSLNCAATAESPGTDRFRLVLGWCAAVAGLCNTMAVASLIINWRNLRDPSKFLAYINACHLLHTLGWALQLFHDRREIACRTDQTTRHGEPNGGVLCVLSFCLLYYSALAVILWYVMLAYAWNLTYGSRFESKQLIRYRNKYFHLAAWSIAFICTLIVLAVGQIDGNLLHGICFVGLENLPSRLAFLALPLTGGLLTLMCLMGRNLRILAQARQAERRPEKTLVITRMMRKITVSMLAAVVILVSFYAINLIKTRNEQVWDQNIHNQIM